LDHADFSGADLTQGILHRTRCDGTSFMNAELEYADFSYADVSRDDFRGSHFMRTQFHRALTADTRWGDRVGLLEKDPPLFDAEQWSAGRPRALRAGH